MEKLKKLQKQIKVIQRCIAANDRHAAVLVRKLNRLKEQESKIVNQVIQLNLDPNIHF